MSGLSVIRQTAMRSATVLVLPLILAGCLEGYERESAKVSHFEAGVLGEMTKREDALQANLLVEILRDCEWEQYPSDRGLPIVSHQFRIHFGPDDYDDVLLLERFLYARLNGWSTCAMTPETARELNELAAPS